jgi:DNA repair exonuclease SbcCD ATPase subunit
MQALSREEQDTLRAILRRVFDEAAVDTLLKALDHLAARGDQGIADLRRWLEGSLGGLQTEVNQLTKGYGSVEEGLARLTVAHARMEEALTRLIEAHARLEEAVVRLAEAQARTEERVARLEEAQIRTEERLARVEESQRRLEEALARLAEAQARTEERVARLEEAQIRTKERLARVEEALARLAEAQARTEERVARLEEAQIRTEERLARVEEALARLAEAQARTEERLARVEEALARLAEAQARTEERLTRVEEGQRRLEEALARLAEAQAQAEERIARLERLMEQVTRQVGALSDVIGGDLEDAAYIVIHDTFTRELGWKVDVLERTFLRWDNHELEVDIMGRAYDPARPKYEIWIVGEAKYNITVGEVERFAKKLPLISEYLTRQGEEKKERLIVPVCFCYRARPEVRERIYDLGFHLVFSYGRVIWGKSGPPVSRRKKTASRKGAR